MFKSSAPSLRLANRYRYTLDNTLGGGGTSTVYRAVDELLDVPRALKVLHRTLSASEPLRRRFLSEARAMARLRHPNVLHVYDVGIDGDQAFVVMELIEGCTLAQRVEADGTVPWREATRWMVDVLDGLALAHDGGVVHRDIKPSNVLLQNDGRVLLADFGIALIQENPHRDTLAGAGLGTFTYMSPEQRMDASTVGPAADIYSSAITLYELIAGGNPMDLFTAGRYSQRWAGIPEPLRPALLKATRYEPDSRYADARGLREALLQALDPVQTAPASDQAASLPPELQRWYQKNLARKAEDLRAALEGLSLGKGGAESRLRGLAHGLRGSGGSFGFPEISEAGAKAEDSSGPELVTRTRALLKVVRSRAGRDTRDEASSPKGLQHPAQMRAALLASRQSPLPWSVALLLLPQHSADPEAGLRATRAMHQRLPVECSTSTWDSERSLVLLPGLTGDQAHLALHKALESLRASPTGVGHGLGVGLVQGQDSPFADLLGRATVAARRSAEQGQLRVVRASPVAPTADRWALLVDDDTTLGPRLRSILAGDHLELAQAASVGEARQLLSQRMPALVLLDVDLPDGDGHSFLMELRADTDSPQVPVLMLTARSAEPDTVMGLELGANDYVSKPFRPAELRARIRRLLS